MPITFNKIDFRSVLEQWLCIDDEYISTISTIQRETGFRAIHALYGEVVMHVTQLEAISYDEGKKDSKFVYPIRKYGSDEVYFAICASFCKAGVTDVGEGISALRNEIAHVGRPKKVLRKLTSQDVGNLNRLIFLVIVGKVLDRLGVPPGICHSYQNRLIPREFR
jgi:hypothetical protein